MQHLLVKEDLSVYYHLVNLFSDIPMIKVIKSFPMYKSDLVLPCVCVEHDYFEGKRFELGSGASALNRDYIIDVYALTATQRDEITYKIIESLDNTILIYNYDEGFPPDVTPSVIGGLDVLSFNAQPLRIVPEMLGENEKLYYRNVINFTALRNTI